MKFEAVDRILKIKCGEGVRLDTTWGPVVVFAEPSDDDPPGDGDDRRVALKFRAAGATDEKFEFKRAVASSVVRRPYINPKLQGIRVYSREDVKAHGVNALPDLASEVGRIVFGRAKA